MFACRIRLVWVFLVVATKVAALSADERSLVDVYVAGSDGYHTYRIPALVASPRGTILAFCEGRKTGRADHGDIDLMLRRSTDVGKSWEPMQVVHEEGGTRPITIGNPCPVVDRDSGTIWLTFCRDNDDVLVTSSSDDGRTWTPPREITADVKQPEWSWYATGPGVGIQLERAPHKGRLVIPCDHRVMHDGRPVMHSHVFYSDDRGQSWQLGGTLEKHTDECQVVELSSGELLINMRNYWARDGGRPERGGMRAIARSHDGGLSWLPLEFDPVLVEPICQASLIAIPRRGEPVSRVLVFSNPAAKDARRNMTVRASFDEGKTWPREIVVDRGSAAYSCLAALPGGKFGLLYEKDDYGRIVFTKIELDSRP